MRRVSRRHIEVHSGNLEFWPHEDQLWIDGRRVPLTGRESEVLWCLARRERHVVAREALYGAVWGGDMPYRDRNVDVNVRKVRLKMAAVAPSWEYIHTHFGAGYRFEPEPK